MDPWYRDSSLMDPFYCDESMMDAGWMMSSESIFFVDIKWSAEEKLLVDDSWLSVKNICLVERKFFS